MKFSRKQHLAARAIHAAALLVLIPALIASCSGGKGKGRDDGSAAVLLVNGQAVSRKYLDEMADLYRTQQLAIMPEKVFESNSADLRRTAARQVAANMLMLEVIGSKGWEADAAVVDARVNDMMAQLGGREAMLKWLEAMGESEESMRKGVAEELMIDSLLRAVTASAAPDDSVMRARYEADRGRYVEPGRVRASQIVLAVDGADPDAERQIPAIMERANEALAKAKAGEDFDALARAYSSIPGNSDMGWFKRGDLIPGLEQTLFSLKVGEVSTLVPSGMGIHILKKTGEEAPRQLTYEEAADGIRRSMEQESMRLTVNAYIDSLIIAADIKFIDPELEFDVNRAESLSVPSRSD